MQKRFHVRPGPLGSPLLLRIADESPSGSASCGKIPSEWKIASGLSKKNRGPGAQRKEKGLTPETQHMAAVCVCRSLCGSSHAMSTAQGWSFMYGAARAEGSLRHALASPSGHAAHLLERGASETVAVPKSTRRHPSHQPEHHSEVL